jgi:hypothetical protein
MSKIEKEQFQVNRRKIYNRIILLLDKNIPRGYKKAVLGCFFINRSTVPSLRLFYLIDGSNEYKDFISSVSSEAIDEINDLCEELYYLMLKNDSRWTSFTFIRERVGRFRAKFKYESIKAVDHMFLLEWRGEYF